MPTVSIRVVCFCFRGSFPNQPRNVKNTKTSNILYDQKKKCNYIYIIYCSKLFLSNYLLFNFYSIWRAGTASVQLLLRLIKFIFF